MSQGAKEQKTDMSVLCYDPLQQRDCQFVGGRPAGRKGTIAILHKVFRIHLVNSPDPRAPSELQSCSVRYIRY